MPQPYPAPARRQRIQQFLVGAAYFVATDPVLFRDREEWLTATAVILAVLVVAAAGWRIVAPPALLVFAAWTAVSFFWSGDPAGSANAIPQVLAFILIGCASARMGSAVVLRGLLAASAVAVAASLAVAVFLPAAGRASAFGGAFVGIYPHRNVLASVAVVGLALALGHVRQASGTHGKAARFLLVALFSVGIAATFSSSAIVISLVLLVGAAGFRIARSIGPLGVLGLLPITLVALVGFVAPAAMRAWEGVAGSLGRDATLTGRTDIWQIVLTLVEDRPLTGYGFGGVWGGAIGDYVRTIFGYSTALSAHSGYLDVLLQLGYVGLLAFAVVVVGAVARAAKLALTSTADAWMILVLLVLLVNSITESQVTRPIGIVALAAIAALTYARRGRPEGQPRPVVTSKRQRVGVRL